MTTAEIHVETSQGFILQADAALIASNSRQASENGWEAAASAVKSVADMYGWRRDTHADLFGVVDNIVRLSGDEEIGDLFASANGLHQNIYEGWLSDEYIAYNIECVKRLLAKLDAFMDAQDNGEGG